MRMYRASRAVGMMVAGALAMGWVASAAVQAAPAAPAPAGAAGAATLKSVLADEMLQIEREVASLMMRRIDQTGDKRAKTDLLIDLRIIRRYIGAIAADAKPDTNDQAIAWLRLKQFTAAARGVEEALADANWAPSPSQKDALKALNKLSFTAVEIKSVKDLDDFCRGLALSLANVVNASPVNPAALPVMRPKPIAIPHGGGGGGGAEQPTIAQLTGDIQRLAAISVPLRQTLLALAGTAGTAPDKEAPGLYNLLVQSVNLARGLQANTAVSPENRMEIETQLAEGIALYMDPRTRDAGKARIDSLSAYRQVLSRIGKMSLTAQQMQQLAPALAWASAAGEPGTRFLGLLEQYMDRCAKWDALPRDAVLPNLKRPLEDLTLLFGRSRNAFMQVGARPAPLLDELVKHVEEMRRIYGIGEDLAAMGPSIEHLNTYKPRPMGALERKVQVAANAAVNASPSVNRNDAEKYLSAVHELAERSKHMATRTLTDVPAPVSQAWSGGKADSIEAKWKAVVGELLTSLIGNALELDKAKVAKFDAAAALGDSLKQAAQLEAALAKIAPLSRWADWSIDPQTLTMMVGTYREALAGAFVAYIGDRDDDRWHKAAPRFAAISALVIRGSAYAEQCQNLPIGLAGDLSRLATRLEGEPFPLERYASCQIACWQIFERLGDPDAADKAMTSLTKRLSRDLRLGGPEEPRRRR